MSVEVASGITRTPNVCGGAACIEGTRIPVWVFLDLDYSSFIDFMIKVETQYPHLTDDQILAVWWYLMYRRPEVVSDAAWNNQCDNSTKDQE